MEEVLDDKKAFGTSDLILIDKHVAVFPFQGVSSTNLLNELGPVFEQRNYKCAQKSSTEYTYSRGSEILRLLAGAFAKYFKWTVRVEQIDAITRLTLIKEARGYAGGIIGMGQVNKEYKVLTDLLTALHTRLNNPD